MANRITASFADGQVVSATDINNIILDAQQPAADRDMGGNNIVNVGAISFSGTGIAQDAWVVVGSGGSAPAFENSWVAFGGSYIPTRFRKTKHGTVRVELMVKSGTVANAAFTLPVGYRPLYAVIVPAPAAGNAPAGVEVRLDGSVVIAFGSTTWTSTAFEFSLT